MIVFTEFPRRRWRWHIQDENGGTLGMSSTSYDTSMEAHAMLVRTLDSLELSRPSFFQRVKAVFSPPCSFPHITKWKTHTLMD